MKFNPDDIIRLAEANPGFGFNRFMSKLLHGKSSDGSKLQVMRLFEIHKAETDVDLYAELQDTSRRRMVTMAELKAITGRKSHLLAGAVAQEVGPQNQTERSPWMKCGK